MSNHDKVGWQLQMTMRSNGWQILEGEPTHENNKELFTKTGVKKFNSVNLPR